MYRRGADAVKLAEGNLVCIAWAGCRGFAGVGQRSMQAEGLPGTWGASPSPLAVTGAGAARADRVGDAHPEAGAGASSARQTVAGETCGNLEERGSSGEPVR